MCPPITFHNIDQPLWETIESKLRAAGIEVQADHGIVHVGPSELQWDFDPAAETLTVTCLHKLFILSCDSIYRQLEDLLQKVAVES